MIAAITSPLFIVDIHLRIYDYCVEVLPTRVESRGQSSSATDRPIYDCGKSRNEGVLFIINNRCFAKKMKLTTREASDVDVAKLYRVFIEFGFKIQVMQDLTASDMLDSIQRGNKAKKAPSCLGHHLLIFIMVQHLLYMLVVLIRGFRH